MAGKCAHSAHHSGDFWKKEAEGLLLGLEALASVKQSGDVSGIAPCPSLSLPPWRYSPRGTYGYSLCTSGPPVYEKILK